MPGPVLYCTGMDQPPAPEPEDRMGGVGGEPPTVEPQAVRQLEPLSDEDKRVVPVPSHSELTAQNESLRRKFAQGYPQ